MSAHVFNKLKNIMYININACNENHIELSNHVDSCN